MEIKDLFYPWVPIYIKLPVLFILLGVILTSNGVFVGNTTEMFSSIGVYTEAFTVAYNAMYIGMGLGLLFAIRTKLRFTNKTLLMGGLFVMLLMNIICAVSSYPELTVVACLILGFVKMFALLEVYIIWGVIWSKKFDSSRFYPFIYCTALCGLFFVTWFMTRLSYTYNWHYAYIFILMLLLLCMIFTLVFVEDHPLRKIFPFYQIDYAGLSFLACFLMFLNYGFVYGKVENWFESKKIWLAFTLSAAFLIICIVRLNTVKRPLFSLKVFRYRKFCLGLLYFFLLGIFAPTTFQSIFTAGVLHYEAFRNTQISLYMIPGAIAGAVLCYIWYLKNLDGEVMIFAGFAAFVCYHIFLYNGFANDFAMESFILPSMIKGFGFSCLYISVGIYATRGLPMPMVTIAAGILIIVRSFLGNGIFTAIYSYLLYAKRMEHYSFLAGTSEQSQSSGGPGYAALQNQAILTASKEMTGYIIIAGLILLLTILITYLYGKLSTYLQPTKSMSPKFSNI